MPIGISVYRRENTIFEVRAKFDYLLPVPRSPVVVECFMAITRSHLPRTGSQGIHVGPIPFDALAIRSTRAWEVVEGKCALTRFSMGLDMALRDGYVYIDVV